MGWRVYGRVFESGELANTNKFQSMKMKRNLILRAVRTWVIFDNDPTFTDLNMKIYSNEVISGANTPVKLLHTSTNVQEKADIFTNNSACREIWFEFDDVPLQGETVYNFVLNGTGYVYSSNSLVAWRCAWPDPVYQAGFTPTAVNLGESPYELYAIGGEF